MWWVSLCWVGCVLCVVGELVLSRLCAVCGGWACVELAVCCVWWVSLCWVGCVCCVWWVSLCWVGCVCCVWWVSLCWVGCVLCVVGELVLSRLCVLCVVGELVLSRLCVVGELVLNRLCAVCGGWACVESAVCCVGGWACVESAVCCVWWVSLCWVGCVLCVVGELVLSRLCAVCRCWRCRRGPGSAITTRTASTWRRSPTRRSSTLRASRQNSVLKASSQSQQTLSGTGPRIVTSPLCRLDDEQNH